MRQPPKHVSAPAMSETGALDAAPLMVIVGEYLSYQLEMEIIVASTARAVRSDFRGLVRYLQIQNLPPTLESFSTLHVGRYLAHYRGLTEGSTLKRWYKSFHGFAKWAVARDFLTKNPMVDINLGWVPVRRREFLFSPEEAWRFLNVDCQTGLSPQVDRVLRLLGLFAGLRRNEYLKLHWRHVDLERGQISIYDSKASRRKGHPDLFDRVIPLAPPVQAALESLRALSPHGPDDPVLLNRQLKPLGKDAFYAAFNAIWSAMGVEDAVPHSLRHSLAGNMLAVGATHADVALLLGHRNSSPDRPTTTDLYITSSLTRVRAFLDRYAELVMSAGTTPSTPALGPVLTGCPAHIEAGKGEAPARPAAFPSPAMDPPMPVVSRPSPSQMAEAVILWRMVYPDLPLTGAEFSGFMGLLGMSAPKSSDPAHGINLSSNGGDLHGGSHSGGPGWWNPR